jgi:hypothetical protein
VSPKLSYLAFVFLLGATGIVRSQQAVSSITQSRLFSNPSAPGTAPVDANGTPLPDDERPATSEDDSFGAQIILKRQERRRSFSVFADVSAFHTSNVDLTPENTRRDSFIAANLGTAWRPVINSQLVGELYAGTSLFRYDRARELDFQKVSAGAGVSWLVPHAPGIIAFGRYDFIELLDSGNREILQDHEFALGAQKIFVFGRSHFLSTGLTGTVGLTAPRSQQRDQAAIHAAYHLQITRSFDTDLLYRYAAQSYIGNRFDHNQTLLLGFGFAASRWLRVTGSISAAHNDSSEDTFDYEALNFGGGVKLDISF